MGTLMATKKTTSRYEKLILFHECQEEKQTNKTTMDQDNSCGDRAIWILFRCLQYSWIPLLIVIGWGVFGFVMFLSSDLLTVPARIIFLEYLIILAGGTGLCAGLFKWYFETSDLVQPALRTFREEDAANVESDIVIGTVDPVQIVQNEDLQQKADQIRAREYSVYDIPLKRIERSGNSRFTKSLLKLRKVVSSSWVWALLLTVVIPILISNVVGHVGLMDMCIDSSFSLKKDCRVEFVFPQYDDYCTDATVSIQGEGSMPTGVKLSKRRVRFSGTPGKKQKSKKLTIQLECPRWNTKIIREVNFEVYSFNEEMACDVGNVSPAGECCHKNQIFGSAKTSNCGDSEERESLWLVLGGFLLWGVSIVLQFKPYLGFYFSKLRYACRRRENTPTNQVSARKCSNETVKPLETGTNLSGKGIGLEMDIPQKKERYDPSSV